MKTVDRHRQIDPCSLGSAAFRESYGVRLAYSAGAMYKRIASPRMVIAMSQAGMLSFLGTGGVSMASVERDIEEIQRGVSAGEPYGANLLHQPERPEIEEQTVDLFLKHGVRAVEAAAYITLTPALIRYRLKGIRRAADGRIETPNRVLAKVSRPEVAELFMKPAPEAIVRTLLEAGRIDAEEAALAHLVPVSMDVCAEADSAGHTDRAPAYALIPSILALRDRLTRLQDYQDPIRIGAAGGIGTPAAAAAAFVMGVDFITTGSINQCTVEAGTSDSVKLMLQEVDVQDTAMAPAGDMFELGAKVQVLSKGVFFPARASRLHELYMRHESLDEIDAKTRTQIEERYFGRSFDAVWAETEAYHRRNNPKVLEEAARRPKRKMALIFKWYFIHTTRLALSGDETQQVNYQVHCGPALGAFNQWVRGTELQSWKNRRTADIGLRVMRGAAQLLTKRLDAWRSIGDDNRAESPYADAVTSGVAV